MRDDVFRSGRVGMPGGVGSPGVVVSPSEVRSFDSLKSRDHPGVEEELVESIIVKHSESGVENAGGNGLKGKKMKRSSSFMKFQEMVFQKQQNGEQNGEIHEAQKSGRIFVRKESSRKEYVHDEQKSERKVSRRNSFQNVQSEDQQNPNKTGKGIPRQLSALRLGETDEKRAQNEDVSGSRTGKGIVRSLSALRLVQAEQEEPEDPVKHAERTASMLNVSPGEYKLVRRGSSAHLIPNEKIAEEIRNRKAQDSNAVEIDAKGNTVLAKRAAGSMKYKLMVKDTLAEPPLYLSSFGQGSWWIDVFSFFHNAARREMQDLYYILTSMNKRMLTLEHSEVQLLYNWMDIFVMYLEWYFKLEEAILFPWLEERLDIPAGLCAPDRAEMKKKFNEMVSETDEFCGRFDYLPVGEVLPQLIHTLHQYIPSLLSYFRRQESLICPMIKEAYAESEKKNLDLQWMNYLHLTTESGVLLECLVRPISNEAKRKEIRHKYISEQHKGLGLFKAKRRIAHNQNKKDFYKDHQRIVEIFYEKWNKEFELAEKEEYGLS